jgi:ATP-dependent DNA ligase
MLAETTLDGEGVALDERGVLRFNLLQNYRPPGLREMTAATAATASAAAPSTAAACVA